MGLSVHGASPFSVGLAIAVVSAASAALNQHRFIRRCWKPIDWLSLSQLLFFPAAIAIGTLCRWTPTVPHAANRTAILSLNALLSGSFVCGAFWVWRMKGFRWFASRLAALIQLPTLGAVIVAGMSITKIGCEGRADGTQLAAVKFKWGFWKSARFQPGTDLAAGGNLDGPCFTAGIGPDDFFGRSRGRPGPVDDPVMIGHDKVSLETSGCVEPNTACAVRVGH
jgi:hypothetical protein